MIAHRDTFVNHALDKGRLAAGAPELTALAAKIECARGGVFQNAKVSPFAPVGGLGNGSGTMKRRITEAQIKALVRLKYTRKNFSALRLQA